MTICRNILLLSKWYDINGRSISGHCNRLVSPKSKIHSHPSSAALSCDYHNLNSHGGLRICCNFWAATQWLHWSGRVRVKWKLPCGRSQRLSRGGRLPLSGDSGGVEIKTVLWRTRTCSLLNVSYDCHSSVSVASSAPSCDHAKELIYFKKNFLNNWTQYKDMLA